MKKVGKLFLAAAMGAFAASTWLAPASALASSACSGIVGYCETIRIPYCIAEEDCYEMEIDLPGEPT